ncbi:hypothetical protein ACFO3J_26070 [Streptomyces polygonati]|uniref:Small CPxCG-related zinc finger protein n=1 Tax=Streptomyces polygonati TaxID=1617087 RepID=A0ABV8HSC5_9ACTN
MAAEEVGRVERVEQVGRVDGAGAAGAAGDVGDIGEAGAVADCVLCGEPTEHPASTRGATLCPVCAWQEAQRTACSG